MHAQHAAPGGELVAGRVECAVCAHSVLATVVADCNHSTRPEDANRRCSIAFAPPAGDPQGALVLFHGRGADEHDLFPLLDILDPERRLLGATLRGPLALPPGGAHWYIVARRSASPIRTPSTPPTRRPRAWLDALLAEHGVPHDRAVLGGFSQGAVMSYALGLGAGRPRPAGILALSGFIPTVDGFALDLETAAGLPVAIGHGAYDPVIPVEFGRDARDRLTAAGAEVTYRESPMPHAIDPGFLRELPAWLGGAVARAPAST